YVSDIGSLLAHRAVGDYTLSTSHLFDLTGRSFAALRLPAALAAVTLLIGPLAGWLLRLKGKHLAATVSIALTMTVFFVAAHIALARFEPCSARSKWPIRSWPRARQATPSSSTVTSRRDLRSSFTPTPSLLDGRPCWCCRVAVRMARDRRCCGARATPMRP